MEKKYKDKYRVDLIQKLYEKWIRQNKVFGNI